MFYPDPESKPEINRDKVIQWGCNGMAIALSLCTLSVNFGRNPQAQLALLAGALPLSLIGGYHGWKSDKRKPYIRMRKQAGIEAYADCLAHQIQDAPALPMAPAPMEPPKYFNWSLIQSQPDKYAHLAIVGGTGDGKSTLTQSLIQFVNEKAVAIDPHWKPGNYPGLPAVAKGRNYGQYPAAPISFEDLVNGKECSYTEAIVTVFAEMDRRYHLLEKGETNFTRYTFVLDEYTTFASIHPKCSGGEILGLLREARKVGLRLILLVHSDSVKSFRWSGEGVLRKCLRWVYLGDFAKEKSAKTPDLYEWVKSRDYPILVGVQPAVLPVPINQMKAFQAETKNQPTNSNADNLPSPNEWVNYLNKMYHLDSEPLEPPNPNCSNSERSEPLQDLQRTHEVTDDDLSDGRVRGGDFEPEPNELHYYSQILKMHKQGMNKSQTIMEIWQVSRGGGSTYQNASRIFDDAKKHWKKLELW